MLFSTVFLFILYVSRSGSVLGRVQWEKSMLPVIGRPLNARRDMQTSEDGVVVTNKHLRLSSSSIVGRNLWSLGDPDPVEQHGKFSGYCYNNSVASLLAPSRCQTQAPLS